MSKLNQQKIPVQLARSVMVTKISDDKFNGSHPNGIIEGYQVKGTILKDPTVGEMFLVSRLGGLFNTSTVTEILDGNTFKTLYSTYKWEVLGEPFEITI